jgi:hypothetical protein
LPERVFNGILNFDDAYFDSRCVECNSLLSWEESGEGFWYAVCCKNHYQIQIYTVLRTIEQEGLLDAVKRTGRE